MFKFRYLALWIGLLVLLSACASSSPVNEPGAPSPVPQDLVATPIPATPAGQGDSVTTPTAEPDQCRQCHTDEGKLKSLVKPAQQPVIGSQIPGMLGEAKAMQAWEKILVDGPKFLTTIHGSIPCSDCHGGVQSDDKDAAHKGMVRNPSLDASTTCGKCHPDVVASVPNSLHVNLAGIHRAINARELPSTHSQVQQAVEANCTSCHTTCGDCHVSQPAQAGGGFISGHLFNRTPSMVQNCAVCHGATAGNEFLGKNSGVQADVHFKQGNMTCKNCHTGNELHGQAPDCQSCHKGPEGSQAPPPGHIYDGVQAPRCETCHIKVAAGKDDIIMHQQHGNNLSCQVCHAVAYNNCEGCHVTTNAQTGVISATLQGSKLGFLIGRNPLQSYERPYRYVPVRHAPIVSDTFKTYGDNLLGNFDSLPTWTYATPHNIQRNTPQNASCGACHGNSTYFLTPDKVSPAELTANKPVIVNQPPPPIGSEGFEVK